MIIIEDCHHQHFDQRKENKQCVRGLLMAQITGFPRSKKVEKIVDWSVYMPYRSTCQESVT